MGKKWERWENDWIKDQFISNQGNIFVIEITAIGFCLYWFDDGPEVPTDSVDIKKNIAIDLDKRLSELRVSGEQVVCEYLAGFFPVLQKYWLDSYGGI